MKQPAISPERRLDLFLTAWLAGRSGDFVGVVDTLASVPPSVLRQDLDLGLMLARAYAELGRTQRARTVLERLRPRVGDRTPDSARLNFTAVESAVLLLEGRMREWAVVSARHWEQALESGNDEMQMGATLNAGASAALQWDLPRAIQVWQRGLDEARHRGVTGLLLWFHHNLARAYRQSALYAEAQRHLETAAALAGPEWMGAQWDQEKSALLLDLGDPTLAEVFALRALERFEALDSPAALCETRLLMAQIAVAKGHLAQAREEHARARALLPRRNLYLSAQVSEEAAVLALLRGDGAGAARAGARARAAYGEMDAPLQVRRLARRLRQVATEGMPREAEAGRGPRGGSGIRQT